MANIENICNRCNGTGEVWRTGVQGYTCGHCGGNGISFGGKIPALDDIVDRCNDILNKCNDIFEKVNV